jgi:hypothetical protein
VVRAAQFSEHFTTAPFTLASVNAQTGEGFDNYVELRGINHNAKAGGNWMGVDYVRLNSVDAVPEPSSALLLLFSGMAFTPYFFRRRRK